MPQGRSNIGDEGPSPPHEADEMQAAAAKLLAWYDRERRLLPWRAAPGQPADPYLVWLSEIMLQQTTVKAVVPYFHKFQRLWPNVEALAAAELDEVLRAWAGLGYYSRARNLHACARTVVARHGGRFPCSESELAGLPGIGPYTAAAIAAIAFGRRAAVVDGNVERVLARFGALRTPLPQAKAEVRHLAAAMVPEQRPGDFAQAMMDLGALICTPRRPCCAICPLADGCRGRALGLQAVLPYRAPKVERPTRSGVAFLLVAADGRILLRRRPDGGLLGGMMEVPSSAWREEAVGDPILEAPLAAAWRRLPGTVRHTFSHFHLELAVYAGRCPAGTAAPAGGSWRWVHRRELANEALPSVMRKVIAHGLGAD